MGITMHALISKDKPTSRAIIATTATPKEQRYERLAKSPRPVNVNPLIAEINLPAAQFDNVLKALSPTIMHDRTQEDGLNDPCDLAPPAEKTNHITPLASLTGVDQQPSMASGTNKIAGTVASPQA